MSILIVTYGNPVLTRRCLTAVGEHIADIDAEVLVLDNASPDETAEVVHNEFPWTIFEASSVNLGFARANNMLAARARGEFILLLNPDAILHDGALESLLCLAAQRPEAGVYGGRTLKPSGEVDPSSCWGFQTLWSLVCFATALSHIFKHNARFDPESLGPWQRDSVRRVDIVTGCLLLIRSRLWAELGGFDEDFWMYGEDQDLALRVHRAGYRPMITPAAVVTHVVGASSAPGKKNVMVLNSRVRLMRKHWPARHAQIGGLLLKCGCAVRALGTAPAVGWRESWQRRREWSGSMADAPTAPATRPR